MNAVLLLRPGDIRLTLTPEVAGRVVLDWLEGREAPLDLTVEQLETLAETLQPGWKTQLYPDCGGLAHDGDEVGR